jgi:hypothetical protein
MPSNIGLVLWGLIQGTDASKDALQNSQPASAAEGVVNCGISDPVRVLDRRCGRHISQTRHPDDLE